MAKKKIQETPQQNQDQILTEMDALVLRDLSQKYPEVEKICRLYRNYTDDPSKGWRGMVTFAQKQLDIAMKEGSANIVDNPIHKTFWEILKGGNTVSKTISSAKEDAKDGIEDGEGGDIPALPNGQIVPIIGPENA